MSAGRWYKKYQRLVRLVPTLGTNRTKLRYETYQSLEFLGTCMYLIDSKVHDANLRTYFPYLCSLYQQDSLK